MKKLEEEHLAVNQKGDIEQLKAKRIMERIRFLAKEVTLTGENRRTRAWVRWKFNLVIDFYGWQWLASFGMILKLKDKAEAPASRLGN